MKKNDTQNTLAVFRLFAFVTIFILALGAAIGPGLAQEEGAVTLEQLQIDLWPEYDHPDMLVVYRVTFASNVTLPAPVRFRIPAAAGEPNAVAVRDVGGSPFTVAYTREVEGEWAFISFVATLPGAQLEYYDPALRKSGDDRNFVFAWPGDYPVNQAIVLVQQPIGATNVVVDPPMGIIPQASDPLTYYGTEFGPVPKGNTFQISVDYQKDNDGLTVDFIEVQPSVPVTEDTVGRVGSPDLTIWLVGIAAAFILAGGVYLYFNNRKSTYAKAVLKGKRAPRRGQAEQAAGQFCHECGQRSSSGDRFCRNCGTQLRKG